MSFNIFTTYFKIHTNLMEALQRVAAAIAAAAASPTTMTVTWQWETHDGTFQDVESSATLQLSPRRWKHAAETKLVWADNSSWIVASWAWSSDYARAAQIVAADSWAWTWGPFHVFVCPLLAAEWASLSGSSQRHDRTACVPTGGISLTTMLAWGYYYDGGRMFSQRLVCGFR